MEYGKCDSKRYKLSILPVTNFSAICIGKTSVVPTFSIRQSRDDKSNLALRENLNSLKQIRAKFDCISILAKTFLFSGDVFKIAQVYLCTEIGVATL